MSDEEKPGRGRPLSLTPEMQKEICNAVSAGSTWQTACDFVGIDVATFYRWRSIGKTQKSGIFHDFYEATKKARAQGRLRALLQIQKAANIGTWQAAAWLLERTDPAHYAPRVRVTIEEELNGFLNKLEKKLPPEVYREVLEAYVAATGGPAAEEYEAGESAAEGGDSTAH